MFFKFLEILIFISMCSLVVVYFKIVEMLSLIRTDFDKFNARLDTIKSSDKREDRFETLKRAFTQPGAGNDRSRPK
jgi:hypothetical protein